MNIADITPGIDIMLCGNSDDVFTVDEVLAGTADDEQPMVRATLLSTVNLNRTGDKTIVVSPEQITHLTLSRDIIFRIERSVRAGVLHLD